MHLPFVLDLESFVNSYGGMGQTSGYAAGKNILFIKDVIKEFGICKTDKAMVKALDAAPVPSATVDH